MNENVRTHEPNDEEINLWELIEHLKSGWHWMAGSGLIGLVCAAGFLAVTPSKYEATAVIQSATIGVSSSSSSSSTVEPVGQTQERLKLVTFYGDDLVKTCQVDSPDELAKGVKISVIKGNSLLSLAFQADSAVVAEACMAKIVGQLAQSQASIAAPLLKELEAQMASTKQQIDDAESFMEQKEKQLTRASVSNESVLLMLKREDIGKLQKLYREQRVQLSEPLTQPMKLLEPIYVPEKAVFPKKTITIVAGLLLGVFVGLLALFVHRSWRHYRATPA